MPLLHIDDRLARLADAATRVAPPDAVEIGAHRTVVSISPSDGSLCADAALELAGTIIEALAAGDADALRASCARSVHTLTPALDTNSPTELVLESRMQAPSGFSDIDVTIKSLIVSELNMSVEWSLRATHTGTLRVGWAAIEPTRAPIVVDGVLVAHLCAGAGGDVGKFVFDDLHLYYDTTTLLAQLGLA